MYNLEESKILQVINAYQSYEPDLWDNVLLNRFIYLSENKLFHSEWKLLHDAILYFMQKDKDEAKNCRIKRSNASAND